MNGEHRFVRSEDNKTCELYYERETGLGNNKFCVPDVWVLVIQQEQWGWQGQGLIASEFECRTGVAGNIGSGCGSDSGGCCDLEIAGVCQQMPHECYWMYVTVCINPHIYSSSSDIFAFLMSLWFTFHTCKGPCRWPLPHLTWFAKMWSVPLSPYVSIVLYLA